MSNSLNTGATQAPTSSFWALPPIVAAVFLGFLANSVPLGALPLEMRSHLDAPASLIGFAIALQSIVTLLTRPWAGTLCDRLGSRFVVRLGLPVAAVSGLANLAFAILPVDGMTGLGIILTGRVLMGIGQSLFLTGLMTWGISRVDSTRTGRVMSWTGIAIYAALGLGAPLGLAVQPLYGFVAIGAISTVVPVLAWLITAPLASPAVPGRGRANDGVGFLHILGRIWQPGLILALSTIPFATLESFLTLDYADHGWERAGAALSGFAIAYVLVRLVASGLPDRIGAWKVALGSLILEAIGQALLWGAGVPVMAVAGATITGLGFSLVFPAMGVIATRSVSPEQRGRAVGSFIAFADVALGVTGPLVGYATQSFGVPSAFLVGTFATVLALAMLPSIHLARSANG